MPARIARSNTFGSSSKAPKKKKNKAAKRSLDAFAIAEAQNTSGPGVRRNRLGVVEDDESRQKRRRDSEDEDEGENERPVRRRKASDESEDEASDEDGNRWKMGEVDEDDDSDIDSEEAFGSSDDERFEGWTFRGGSGAATGKNASKRSETGIEAAEGLTLEEDDAEESDGESLGSDAVDLATMLDNYEGSGTEDGSVNDGEGDDTDEETPPSEYSSDEDDGHDLEKAARLQDLVTTLQPKEKTARKLREAEVHESKAPSAAGIVSSEKFDINDFLAATSDPSLKKISKELGSLPKTPKKDPKLAPSLPKRQKDKLERIAAKQKAKETLDRWVDTVKQQRRADHLHFPLIDPHEVNPMGSKQFLPASQSKPQNDLEAAIQHIMQESGLGGGKPDEEEQRIRQFEELQANKLPLEEVQARRAELRKARDLLFREEVRAKRIKKIKSKAFRRIKRKEREKLAAHERDIFAADMDGEMEEQEREAADRRRAEERMGLKHKESKWAKQMKRSGRTGWDDDVISGVTEMARKNDELRRRIQGHEIRDEDRSGDELLDSDEDDEQDSDADGGDADGLRSLQRDIQKAADSGGNDKAGGSRLLNLKFMRDAEGRRKKENMDMLREMRHELEGRPESGDEGVEETVGRKIFAPGKAVVRSENMAEVRGEFEELDDERNDEDVQIVTDQLAPTASNVAVGKSKMHDAESAPSRNPISAGNQPTPSDSKRKRKKSGLPEPAPDLLPGEQHSAPDTDGWVTVTYGQSPDQDSEEAEADASFAGLSNTDILRRAFAGDDVEDAFSAEKHATIEDEADKIIDSSLPGWGSWVGSDLSKRDRRRRAPHANQLRTIEGIRPHLRKDAKLNNVIINQKRVRANSQYLASTLPHQFGNRMEYEGSIRMPLGKAWNTTSVARENVKPRVVVRQGSVVKPISRPLV